MLTTRPHAFYPEPFPLWLAAGEEVRLHTSDGESLGSWYLPGLPQSAAVVVLHGHESSRTEMIAKIKLLHDAGLTVLAPSFRAHGDSTGQGCDIGWSSRQDVVASVVELGRRVSGRPIVVYGFSMGAAAAVFAAKDLGSSVQAYVLESPYPDLEEAIDVRLKQRLPSPLVALAKIGLRLWAPQFLPVPLAEISPTIHVRDIPSSVPILVVVGDSDPKVPIDDLKPFLKGLNGRSRLAEFRGAGHGDAISREPERYRELLVGFIRGVH